MQKLLVLTMSLVVFFVLLMFTVVMLAHRFSPMPPAAVALFGFEQNSTGQVCWPDICPGLTTLEQAEAILRSRANEVNAIQRTASNVLTWKTATHPAVNVITYWDHTTDGQEVLTDIIFQFDGSLRLGDIINLFGTPIATNRICGLDRHPASFGNRIPFTVFFANGVYVTVSTPNYRQRVNRPQDARQTTFLIQLSPLMPIASIGYSNSTLSRLDPEGYNPWRGFGEIESVITPC